MILRGGRVAVDACTTRRIDLGIEAGRLRLSGARCRRPDIDCSGLLILPGLINAHDHLEFNLFPQLGRGPYPNATAWARDIYHPAEPPIREHLAVPKNARLTWGALKNLVCGVTTVMHHNSYQPLFDGDYPIRVLNRFGWAHSIAFSPDFALRYRATPRELPFFIHACEGTEVSAAGEVRALDSEGVLAGNTVLIHGVALDSESLEILRERGASLVWCPTSNRFTLGSTLSSEVLASGIPIALGTDSGLTAAADLIDEAFAAALIVGWERAYRMVTTEAAKILRLRDGQGEIREGGVADLLLVRDCGQSPAECLREMHPELVFVGGELKLADAGLSPVHDLPRLCVEGRGNFLVDCELSEILKVSTHVLGPDVRLAGKRVAA